MLIICPKAGWKIHLFWAHFFFFPGSSQKQKPSGLASSWLLMLFFFSPIIGMWRESCFSSVQFTSVQLLSHVRLFVTPWITAARPPCPSPTPGVYPNPRPLSWWCHSAISSSVVPFSSCPNPSQHQGLFQWVNSSHEVAKVLEFLLQHQSFQWTPRTDLL